jgi:hypothetical protein
LTCIHLDTFVHTQAHMQQFQPIVSWVDMHQ